MKVKIILCIISFWTLHSASAQSKSPIALQEVLVTDPALTKYSNSLQVKALSDSVFEKNYNSLTNVLRYNSLLYFKENGNGMVSSVSFRGTTASQTAVIWNGISINSQLLGQTDFNTITPVGYSSIAVRSGGGSGIYGSAAIGGSVHLNNELQFKKQFTNTARINIGSFNTQGYFYGLQAGDRNWTVQANVSRNSSSNNYQYLNQNQRNQNGEYENMTFSANAGYRWNATNTINFYGQLFDGDRNFSGTLAFDSNSKYKDLNSRNLLEWINKKNFYTSSLKAAYITEDYKYFENKNNDNHTNGGAKTKLIKYDFEYVPSAVFSVNPILSYTSIRGYGSSINNAKREVASAGMLLKYAIDSKVKIEATARQEVTSNYSTPFLYAAGIYYTPLKNYKIRVNTSKNFRVPTFNDLYWQGSGNLDLKPELSRQIELGQEVQFGNFNVSATVFYIDTRDMIRWLPNENGIWKPINTDHVKNKGAEITGHFRKKINKQQFDFDLAYAYTSAVDQARDKQLTYVPYHKVTGALDYSIKNWSFNYQLLFNGAVFTTTDNLTRLKEYQVSNLSTFYKIGKKEHYKLGFQIMNIFNKSYQTVEIRPMPGINYNLSLTIKY
ncbi:hypothetical protein FFWV33_16875 [Flavobacterium faecale]|uniref:TonB-dependent receptor n=1 Tax=Flavobacterium faecale TaxID=1355330 RepID=A0A2S1LH97_9FLAO|nr:TonB-dependent receptor [Flavobacterium faecale]AWG23078.1 hypothetical protein FFWV33_16875 [Flavobacterium faecale]